MTLCIENRTSELVQAKAAADAANLARLKSERERAEEAVRKGEERLRLALEASRMGTFDRDIIRNQIVWSRQHEALFGYAPGEFDGTEEAFEERVHPEDLPGIKAEIARCIAARTSFAFEFRVLWPDGSEHWVESKGEFRFADTGQVVQMHGVAMDVTERKQAEEALRKSEEHYRVLAEAAHDMIILINGRREVKYANTFAACRFRCSPQELIGKRLSDIFPPEIAARQETNLQKVFESGESLYVEAPSTFPSNSLWLGSWLVPIRDPSGEITAVLVASRDISERKQVEQALKASLTEKEVLMREIHHRVKNNLQMMSALLELQSRDVKDARAQAYFKDSQQRIQSMAMIHAQLYQNQNLAQIDFAAYLQSLVDNLRGQYEERCKQVNVRVNAQACTLPVDTAVPLGLVVNELVSNAMKHAFPGGRAGELRIGLQCGDEGKVVLEVSDDGVGLPAGLDWRDSQSFGLQLITLMVQKQLHGKLTVESNNGIRVVCEIEVQE